MGVAFAALDLWQLVTGTVNPNVHMPFLMPIFFAAMAGITLQIRRHR